MPAVDFILTGLTGRQVSGAMSMYWIYMLIPVGCLVLAGHVAVAMWRTLRAGSKCREGRLMLLFRGDLPGASAVQRPDRDRARIVRDGSICC